MNNDEHKILLFLKAIELGVIRIKPDNNVPNKVYSGNVKYLANNGWSITIFNDANTWDYIDNLTMDDGLVVGFDRLDSYESIRNYEPPLDVVKNLYKICQ